MPFTSQERSGTPVETRDAAGQLGDILKVLLSGGSTPTGLPRSIDALADPVQRQGVEAVSNLLRTQIGNQTVEQILAGALAPPSDRTSDLFEALRPFEAQETERQVAGLRESFGRLGGRFSGNLLKGEADLRSDLGRQFRRTREEFLLESGAQRNQALAQTLQLLLQGRGLGQSAGSNALAQLFGFLRPGPPVIEQGILPGLIQAGGQVGAAAAL